ncbi:MAG: hypothetical protein LBP57_01540 [Endomicrobium sp.]|jgi:hypothetical protein|nr:hypothetical protein [Endomicrobium sp.]
MKKVLMLSFLFVMFFNLESYAGRGFFGCCCCDDDIVESYGISNKPLIAESVPTGSIPSEVTVSKFDDFKKYYTADGECRIHIPPSCLFTIREPIRSGRGNKGVVFDRKSGEEGKGVYLTYSDNQVKVLIRQGSVVHNDGFLGMIYHNDGTSPTVREVGPDIFK